MLDGQKWRSMKLGELSPHSAGGRRSLLYTFAKGFSFKDPFAPTGTHVDKPCKIRGCLQFQVDPCGLIYPSNFFTSIEGS
jgi:hypothetical protein